MKNLLKVIGMAIIIAFYACQENSTEINSEKDAWNWGFNKIKEQENVVLMQDHLKLFRYKNAKENFQWLIEENPKLHPSIYESGLAIYQGLIDESQDQATKLELKIEKEKIANLKEKYFSEVENN